MWHIITGCYNAVFFLALLFPDSYMGSRLCSWTAETQINLLFSKENYNVARGSLTIWKGDIITHTSFISSMNPASDLFLPVIGNKYSLTTISIWSWQSFLTFSYSGDVLWASVSVTIMLRSFCVKIFVTLFWKYDILLTFLPPAGFINIYCHYNYSLPHVVVMRMIVMNARLSLCFLW